MSYLSYEVYWDINRALRNGVEFKPFETLESISLEYEFGGMLPGMDEEFYTVYKLTMTNSDVFYLRSDAYYNSWEGTYCGDSEAYIVTPQEKTIIVWK